MTTNHEAMSFNTAPTESFDVIVVSGGHAGGEAAITVRLGLNTALFSLNLDRIACKPCNPAAGGSTASMGFTTPSHFARRYEQHFHELADETLNRTHIKAS